MINNTKSHLIFFIFLLIVLVGCNVEDKSSLVNNFPDIGIPVENVNMYLKVTAPVVTLSFKNDNQIILLLENLTQNHILINPAEDVKIYIKSTSGWERVNNNINYINTNANVPVQSSDLPVGKTLGIFPDLQGNVPVTLRVIVIGRPENMLGVTNIISYVDITVNP